MSQEEGVEYLEMRSHIQILGLGLASDGNQSKLRRCTTRLDLSLKRRKEGRDGGRKGGRSAATAWGLGLERVIIVNQGEFS